MTAYADIAVVVLAAGQGVRFGSDKLIVDLNGQPLGLHTANTIAPMGFGWNLAVCSSGSALSARLSATGFDLIANDDLELGQAHSLHLAVKAATRTTASALLVMLGDMPFVTAIHIDALVAAFNGDMVASFDGTAAMPPALFPRHIWSKLLAASGDNGARELLADARLVAAPAPELRDIDIPTDLASCGTITAD